MTLEQLEYVIDLHDRGLITDDQMMSALKSAVNAAAIENGYAEFHGIPFPEQEPSS